MLYHHHCRVVGSRVHSATGHGHWGGRMRGVTGLTSCCQWVVGKPLDTTLGVGKRSLTCRTAGSGSGVPGPARKQGWLALRLLDIQELLDALEELRVEWGTVPLYPAGWI